MKVLALHGAGGSPADWDPVISALDGAHEIVPLTLEAPWDWDSVLDRIEPHATDNPAVLGMSLGGMVAALWGRRHPECPAVIDIDGHGVPTQPQRYLDPTAVADDIIALRELFQGFGQPELQQAIEELDCFKVFHDVRCPMLLAVATKPMPGQTLFEQYHEGLLRDLPTLPPNIEVVRMDTSHAAAFENPTLVATLIKDYLDRR
ncbi:pimeloyl-ACP methyl ester carboxylesterase [Saccharothrix ecbatanensis]|uniref:Pimeloyl-ACP methyl ester carboxylesterase n=1 Tax=Saccharothrix ecbatanensis TaxID=1105145 RepID=A0A7W9M584_9PSEU|nr:alpha/beta hydrolase [Saccharothrix ecbatanensis]MBB5807912.1 pimeloyl-ACP methyl ester carboxylesterase [Saccharothrix ecbatanensis]